MRKLHQASAHRNASGLGPREGVARFGFTRSKRRQIADLVFQIGPILPRPICPHVLRYARFLFAADDPIPYGGSELACVKRGGSISRRATRPALGAGQWSDKAEAGWGRGWGWPLAAGIGIGTGGYYGYPYYGDADYDQCLARNGYR
jgi:hypothetical protein